MIKAKKSLCFNVQTTKNFSFSCAGTQKGGKSIAPPAFFTFFRYISGYFCFASFFVMPQVLASMKKIRRMPT